jgi:hypothetical protein
MGCSDAGSRDATSLAETNNQSDPQVAASNEVGTGVASAEWDGRKGSENDEIIVLTFAQTAVRVLLNGETALAKIDNESGSASLLIRSDETGISCTNTVIVEFAEAEKGQAVINHCHGDKSFKITPGTIADYSIGKQEVDNPAEDAFAVEAAQSSSPTIDPLSMAYDWENRGFRQLSADYKWQGGGSTKNNSYVTLGVPETDDQVLAASCIGGQIEVTLLLYDQEPQMGSGSVFQAEVEGQKAHFFDVIAKPYGEGFAYGLKLDPAHPLLAEMTNGAWAYWQVGGDEGRGKLRVSLQGIGAQMSQLTKVCRE